MTRLCRLSATGDGGGIRMNGVERGTLPEVTKEAPYEKESEGRRLSSSEWPSRGEVSFVNVAAKYRPELPRGGRPVDRGRGV